MGENDLDVVAVRQDEALHDLELVGGQLLRSGLAGRPHLAACNRQLCAPPTRLSTGPERACVRAYVGA